MDFENNLRTVVICVALEHYEEYLMMSSELVFELLSAYDAYREGQAWHWSGDPIGPHQTNAYFHLSPEERNRLRQWMAGGRNLVQQVPSGPRRKVWPQRRRVKKIANVWFSGRSRHGTRSKRIDSRSMK